MPHQTPLTGPQPSPTAGVRSGVAGLLQDVATLAELQLKLLAVDAGDASRRALLPAALLGGAAIFGLSSLPLLLIALAQLLRDQAGWPPAVATLAAVAAGLLVAGALATTGALLLRRSLEPLARSRDEFNRNVAWLKSSLQREESRNACASSAGPWPNQPR